jgi:hypothetical protein
MTGRTANDRSNGRPAGLKSRPGTDRTGPADRRYRFHLWFKLRQELQLTVIHSLDSGRNLLVRRNRNRLIKIASTLLLLAKQMIAIRGHVENER